MKITRRKLRELILESFSENNKELLEGRNPYFWREEPGYWNYGTDSEPLYRYNHNDDHARKEVEGRPHPSRQIGSGNMGSEGKAYWENHIVRQFAQTLNDDGSIKLNKVVKFITGDEDSDFRDTVLRDIMDVIEHSDKIEIDSDLNIYLKRN